jgi:hypothetical protein
MRVKVSLDSPLSELKFWHSVGDVKVSALICDIAAIAGLEDIHLSLQVDGFNLLPNADCSGVLREGDLITYVELS